MPTTDKHPPSLNTRRSSSVVTAWSNGLISCARFVSLVMKSCAVREYGTLITSSCDNPRNWRRYGGNAISVMACAGDSWYLCEKGRKTHARAYSSAVSGSYCVGSEDKRFLPPPMLLALRFPMVIPPYHSLLVCPRVFVIIALSYKPVYGSLNNKLPDKETCAPGATLWKRIVSKGKPDVTHLEQTHTTNTTPGTYAVNAPNTPYTVVTVDDYKNGYAVPIRRDWHRLRPAKNEQLKSMFLRVASVTGQLQRHQRR